MSLAHKLGRAFPRVMGPAMKSAQAPKQSLNEIRSQIWRLRAEFWYRKVTTYPEVWSAAKVEARQLAAKLRNPGEFTYRQLAEGAVCGVQVFGCFCLGEMWGRKSVVGYPVGPDPSHLYH